MNKYLCKKCRVFKVLLILFMVINYRSYDVFSSGYYVRSAVYLMKVHNEKSYKKADKLFSLLLKRESKAEYYYYHIKNVLNWAEYVGRSDSLKHEKLLHKAKKLINKALREYKNDEQKKDFQLMRSLYYGLKGKRAVALKILNSVENKFKGKRYYAYLRWKFSGFIPDPFCNEIDSLIEKYPRFFKARFDRARSYFNHNILHIATKEARYCVNLRPRSPWTLTFYGVCILEHNNPYRAIGYFQKVLSIEKYSPAIFEMGRSLYLYGKLKKSLYYFKKAVQLNPGHIAANFYLGKSYMILKKNKKAIKHFNRYIELNPNGIDVGDVQIWIKRLKKESEKK